VDLESDDQQQARMSFGSTVLGSRPVSQQRAQECRSLLEGR
jgi:hypothetical protein